MFVDYEKAAEILRNSEDAVIITHRSPDGDCIGSAFGLKEILAELGVRSRVVCHDIIPDRYSFLTNNVMSEDFEPKTIIAVDVADTKLMGKYEEIYGGRVDLCIDHHISNKDYAQYTLLEGEAAAACEVIYSLAKYMNVKMSEQCIRCLYTGMATDSGCFKYSCTTPRTHEIAAEMMRNYSNIDYAKINRYMFEVRSLGRMKLEAKLIDLIDLRLDGKFSVVAVTQQMMKDLGIEIDELEGFAPLTIQLDGTEVGLLIRERSDGAFKCSLRSADQVNVSDIAQTLDGGGHAKAAGCTIEGHTLEEAVEMVTEAVRKALTE